MSGALHSVFQDHRAFSSVPGAPTIGTATVSGSTTVTLGYTAGTTGGSPITGYYAFTSNGVAVTVLSYTATTMALTGLTPATIYQFYIKAVNAVGIGLQSGTSTPSVTTWTTPGAPTIGTVTVSATSISVPFLAGSTGGTSILSYHVYVNSSPYQTGITTSPYAFTGAAGSSYYFTMYALNAVGYGPVSNTSNTVSCTQPYVPPPYVPPPPTYYRPSPPIMGTATVSGLNLSFPWTAPVNDGGLTIDVYRVDINGTTYTTTALPSKNPTTGTGVANSTYYCEMYAHNAEGWSDVSNRSNTLTCYTVPGAASSLSFTQTGVDSGNLSFTNPANNGATIDYYYIYNNYVLNQQVNGAGTPLALTNIANNYSITIKAHNAAGFGEFSTPTTASMIPIPGVFTITVSNSTTTEGGKFDLSYTYSSGGTPSSWSVYSFANYGDYTTGMTLRYTGSDNPATITGFANNITYYIAAYGRNVAGYSQYWSYMLSITPAVTVVNPVPGIPSPFYSYSSGTTGYIFFTAGTDNGLPILAYNMYDWGTGQYYSCTGTTSPVSIPNLIFGRTYTCYLRAMNANGWGPLSANTVVLYIVRPTTSATLSYSNLTYSNVTLTETTTGGDPATFFGLYTYPGYVQVGSYTTTGSQSVPLEAGTPYSFIAYCTSNGGGVWSNIVSFTSPSS